MTLSGTTEKVTQGVAGEAIQSFDFFDLASGRAYKTLYCGDLGASGASVYRMSTSKFYSSMGVASGAATGNITDEKFDMVLNRPMIVKGDTYINIPMLIVNTTGSPVGTRPYIVAGIHKVSNGVEAGIVSGSYNHWNQTTAASTTDFKMVALSLSMPRTKFKKGDTLRLSVIASGASTPLIMIGHDPMQRDYPQLERGTATGDTWLDSMMSVQLPIEIV